MNTDDLQYEDIKRLINTLPTTWYPALLKEMIHAALRKSVFRPGGATRLVDTWEKDWHTQNTPDASRDSISS